MNCQILGICAGPVLERPDLGGRVCERHADLLRRQDWAVLWADNRAPLPGAARQLVLL